MTRMLLLALAFGLVTRVARSETSYAYEGEGDTTYVVTVPEGETNVLSGVAAQVLDGNQVTVLVKRGLGTLRMTTDIPNYEGDIRIEAGVLRTEPNAKANMTMGKCEGGGAIYVLDGATCEILSPELVNTHLLGKAVSIEGRGFDGRGALSGHEDNASQENPTFGANITLTADALICNHSPKSNVYLGVRYRAGKVTINLNNHVLTTGGTGPVLISTTTFSKVPESDAIIVDGRGLDVMSADDSSLKWNLWHTEAHIVMTNGSSLMLNEFAGNSWKWNFDFHSGSGIIVYGSPEKYNNYYNYLEGNMNLIGSDLKDVRFYDDYYVIVGSKVAGSGFRMPEYRNGGRLYLLNGENTFTNGVVVAQGTLFLNANGALPAAGGDLVMTNSAVQFKAGVEYDLPALAADGAVTVTGGTGVWRGAVTKTGAGNLTYASLIGGPLLDAQGGTVLLQPEENELAAFAAVGGRETGAVDFAGQSYSADLFGTPALVNCPSFAVRSTWTVRALGLSKDAGLVTQGQLSFADGAVLTIPDSAEVDERRNLVWTLATAEGGIVGMPVLTGVDSVWTLEKTADGKCLVLKHSGHGLAILLK